MKTSYHCINFMNIYCDGGSHFDTQAVGGSFQEILTFFFPYLLLSFPSFHASVPITASWKPAPMDLWWVMLHHNTPVDGISSASPPHRNSTANWPKNFFNFSETMWVMLWLWTLSFLSEKRTKSLFKIHGASCRMTQCHRHFLSRQPWVSWWKLRLANRGWRGKVAELLIRLTRAVSNDDARKNRLPHVMEYATYHNSSLTIVSLTLNCAETYADFYCKAFFRLGMLHQ